jgi:hypothetical protein
MFSSITCGMAATGDRLVVDAVAGVDLQPEVGGQGGAGASGVPDARGGVLVAVAGGVAEGAGVQFDTWAPCGPRPRSGAGSAPMNRDTREPAAFRLGTKGRDPVVAAGHVEAALGGALLARSGTRQTACGR